MEEVALAAATAVAVKEEVRVQEAKVAARAGAEMEAVTVEAQVAVVTGFCTPGQDRSRQCSPFPQKMRLIG